MLILYTATIFLSALLLFLVQPMIGRFLLPLLGGAPAVWNTAMVFFQTALLAGYGYAHVTTRWLGLRRQVWLHLLVLALPLAVLPISIPRGWTPPVNGNPVLWLLGALAVVAGLPFVVVSATGPLLQRWFSASGHRQAADPYFLYAASNAGSLLALLAYPVWIEPRWRLSEQSGLWAVGYVLLAVLIVACGWWVQRSQRPTAPATAGIPVPPLEWRRQLRWVFLAFVPCSLMLSVTTYITTEIAPVPLLWVIPLGIYLLTFILAFARRRILPHRWLLVAMPVTVLSVVVTLTGRLVPPIEWRIGLHLLNLFVVALVCHGELANDRPAVEHLTGFYLLLSVGGVLGGMFNALLAPVIFRTVAEYPFTLVLSCLAVWHSRETKGRQWLLDLVIPGLVGVVVIGLNTWRMTSVWMLAIPAVLCLVLWRRPLGFGLAIAAMVLVGAWVPGFADFTLTEERSFFGIHRVGLDPTGRFCWLLHGNTIHGIQSRNPANRHEPLAYFTRSGPFGQAFAALPAGARQSVGVIGLGAGSLACYAEPGQHWTFFEIDPVVLQLARNSGYFTFLRDCQGQVEFVLGDARLSLQRIPDGQFGTLILDAYSSDTIPLHLITREALALYQRKVAKDGVLIFHISNRYLRLERVLGALAHDAHLACLAQGETSGNTAQLLASGKIGSKWVVMTRDATTLGDLARDPRWSTPPERLATRVWTDDYASIFSVWH